jgi:hypothetical protein
MVEIEVAGMHSGQVLDPRLIAVPTEDPSYSLGLEMQCFHHDFQALQCQDD